MVSNNSNNKQPEVLEYPKCRACGSEELLILQLATKEEEKGINPSIIPNFLHVFQFIMRRQDSSILIGSKAPSGTVCIDVCKECGTIRAVRIDIGEAVALNIPGRG